MKTKLIAVAVVGAALTFHLPAESHAAPGKLVPTGVTPLEGVGAVGFSADGRSAYASSADRFTAYDRDPATGALSFAQCLSRTGDGGCIPFRWIQGVGRDVEVPADGRSVYLTVGGSPESGLILLGFQRDPATGRLTLAQCEFTSYGTSDDKPDCRQAGWQEATQIEVSPDGRALFVSDSWSADNTGDGGGGIYVYRRDPATSLLTETAFRLPAFGGVARMAVGGASLHALERTNYPMPGGYRRYFAVTSFRQTATAGLKKTGCVAAQRSQSKYLPDCRRVPRMGRPDAIAASPVGRSVVTAGNGTLALFANAKKTGLRLVWASRVAAGDATRLAYAADGRSLYALAVRSGRTSLLRYKLTARGDRLAFAQCLTESAANGCTRVPQLQGATEIDVLGRSLSILGPAGLVQLRAAR